MGRKRCRENHTPEKRAARERLNREYQEYRDAFAERKRHCNQLPPPAVYWCKPSSFDDAKRMANLDSNIVKTASNMIEYILDPTRLVLMDLLNLPRNSERKQVESMYRRTLHLVHPDRCSAEGSEEATQKLTCAYMQHKQKH